MAVLLSILTIALMIGAMVDIIRRDDAQVKFLPKLAWLIVVILLPLIGALLWFGLGREYGDSGIAIPRLRMRRPPRPQAPASPPPPPRDTRTTEQQIADLDREIEEWRLRDEVEKRKREGTDPEREGKEGESAP